MTPSRHLAAVLAAAVLGMSATLMIRHSVEREKAPSVAYTLLDGRHASTQELRGKVVLVNFCATSSAICLHEMPKIISTYQRFRSRGYDTLAVSMSYDAPAAVIAYAQRRSLPFGVAIDNTGAIAQSFGNVQSTPTSLLIDKHGRIVKRFVGEPNFAELDALVEKLLAEA